MPLCIELFRFLFAAFLFLLVAFHREKTSFTRALLKLLNTIHDVRRFHGHLIGQKAVGNVLCWETTAASNSIKTGFSGND